MKPRFICRKGVWYCYDSAAFGSGCSIASAWESWARDRVDWQDWKARRAV